MAAIRKHRVVFDLREHYAGQRWGGRGIKSKCKNLSGKARFAYKMRSNPTKAEQKFWYAISGRQLGPAFRRQAIIFGWIADFWCGPLRLVVEIDGQYHNEDEQREKDQYRNSVMNDRGINVLRFSNEVVEASVPRRLQEALRDFVSLCGHSPKGVTATAYDLPLQITPSLANLPTS